MFRRKRQGAVPRVTREPGEWKALWGPRMRWVGVIIVLVGLSAGLYEGERWLLEPGRFPLHHVRVVGELRNLSKAEVAEMVQGVLGRNFFALNIDLLRDTFAANPWIDRIGVRRVWPDIVELKIRERIPFGYWGEQEMVDINGQRFRPNAVRQPGPWPKLVGPDGHEKHLIHVWNETDALLGKVGLRLVGLVLDQRRAWSMEFANGIKINLGREHFGQRLQRFLEIYPRVLANQSDKIAVVDLRYTNGFAVRWTDSPRAESRLHSRSHGDEATEAALPGRGIPLISSG